MQNFYDLLGLGRQDNLDTIVLRLAQLNQEYRRRTNHKDAAVRNEATEMITLIGLAAATFDNEQSRAEYDQTLEESKRQPQPEPQSQAADETNQAAIAVEIDFYRILGLPLDAPPEEIERRIYERQQKLALAPFPDKTVNDREQQALIDAYATLLDSQQRETYNNLLLQKRSYDAARLQAQTVPLIVGETPVETWQALERALAADPEHGLFLLRDGEIEAWVRWGLGEVRQANWVRTVAMDTQQSETPYMVFNEFLRTLNPARPLVLHYGEQSLRAGMSVTLNTAKEFGALADQHWALFTSHFDLVLDWMTQGNKKAIFERYQRLPTSDNVNIQLERLIYTINPKVMPPMVTIEGGDFNIIDFGTVTGNQQSSTTLRIVQSGRGYLYGTISTPNLWLTLSEETFAGPSTTITASVVPNLITEGAIHIGRISLQLLDGRIPDITLEVRLQHRTTWQSMKNIFKKD